MAKKPGTKKQSKKIDLTHLADGISSRTPLADSIPPEPEKPTEESATPSIPISNEVQPSVEDKIIVPTPENSATVKSDASPTSLKEPEPNQRPHIESKPQRAEIKTLQTLSEATNAKSEVFQTGDKILVRAPWGATAVAEIVTLYQDNNGEAWAHYLPTESIPPNWSWLSGCIRVPLLIKADPSQTTANQPDISSS
jgi:hypothetical protein